MREILFRGKRIDNGEWVEGGICDYDSGVSIFVVNHYDGTLYEPPYTDLDEIDVIPETVEQYTGLTDKNGKKIFEGDIVKFYEHYDNCSVYCDIGYIVYRDENAKFLYYTPDSIVGYSIDSTCILEVIGNIHDNPELLEEK